MMKAGTVTPTMFGEEVLSHPQPESRRPKKNEIFPTDLEILREEATKLVSRLGDGMEDVSFREFADLLLATSEDILASETPTGRSPFPIDMYLLIERDIAPENRASSVLRKIYRCSLKSLHEVRDPPAKVEPTMSSSTVLTTDSIIDENGFPVSISNDFIEQIEREDRHCNDRPPPMSPLSRASTTESSSTASSWSTVSFTNCKIDDNNDENSSSNDSSAAEYPPKWPCQIGSGDDTASCRQEQQSTISIAPDSPIMDLVGTNLLSSFHFVSIDDDDSDESIYDDEVAGETNSSANGENNADDSSMIVFVEDEEDIQRDRGQKRAPIGAQADNGLPDQDEKSSTSTSNEERRRLELPHDFEVFAIAAASGSGSPASNRNRTFSVTTTTTSANGTERSRHDRGTPRRSRRSSDPNPRTPASSSRRDSVTPDTEPTDGSFGTKRGRRQRHSDGSVVSFSDKFRKMMKRRPKNTGSF